MQNIVVGIQQVTEIINEDFHRIERTGAGHRAG